MPEYLTEEEIAARLEAIKKELAELDGKSADADADADADAEAEEPVELEEQLRRVEEAQKSLKHSLSELAQAADRLSRAEPA